MSREINVSSTVIMGWMIAQWIFADILLLDCPTFNWDYLVFEYFPLHHDIIVNGNVTLKTQKYFGYMPYYCSMEMAVCQCSTSSNTHPHG